MVAMSSKVSANHLEETEICENSFLKTTIFDNCEAYRYYIWQFFKKLLIPYSLQTVDGIYCKQHMNHH